jgi:hypothetical protein
MQPTPARLVSDTLSITESEGTGVPLRNRNGKLGDAMRYDSTNDGSSD